MARVLLPACQAMICKGVKRKERGWCRKVKKKKARVLSPAGYPPPSFFVRRGAAPLPAPPAPFYLSSPLAAKAGMTLIEILVALAIFTISFLVLIDAQNLNIRSSSHAHRMSVATILAQDKMTETLLRYKDKSLTEIREKEEGSFEEEYSKYRWEITSRDFAYDLSFLAAMAESGGEASTPEESQSPLLAYLPKISQFIKNSSKEITVSVFWREGATERNISITTHLFNYKNPLPL